MDKVAFNHSAEIQAIKFDCVRRRTSAVRTVEIVGSGQLL